jgi:lipopolysaccharide/colanic/teichoic acid biosynthesis glycosyltransferase
MSIVADGPSLSSASNTSAAVGSAPAAAGPSAVPPNPTAADSVVGVGATTNLAPLAPHDPHAPFEAVARPRLAAWLDRRELLVPAEGNRSPFYLAAKRALDVAGALGLLVLLAPLMLLTYAALFVTTRGRPLFRQERVGHRGRMFPMYKFRTMRLDALAVQAGVKNEKDGPIFKNRRDPRITKLGRWLRSFSIDETPQLFNILAGHMSLVGPRPPIASEVVQYQPWQFRRLAVQPGLTCLWQVSGRSEIGFDDWVRMDLWYLENQSLWTDLRLLVRTPLTVLSRRGAY